MPLSLVRLAAATSFLLTLLAGAVRAQAAPAEVAGPAVALLPPAWRAAFDVAAGTVQSLAVREAVAVPGATEVDVVLGGAAHTLELHRFDVRAASFQLWLRTPAGAVPTAAPDPGTFRGTLRGEPGSAVAATVRGTSVTAYVRRADGTLWIVQPLADAVAGAPATTHVVFRGADGTAAGGRCGVEALPPATPAPAAAGGNDAWYVCELALEADHPLFLLNGGSVAATQTDVLGVVNAVDLIFRNDVQVHFVVSHVVVDTAPDPYTTNVAPTLLAQFQGQWNASHAALSRDLAHLFTGRPLAANSNGTIGYAFVGVVCDQTNGYGVSQTRWSANYAYRVGVTAHELGHGFNASHCDAQSQCSVMCSIIGGCSGNTGALSATERAEIVQYRAGVTCLQLQQTVPQITSATPTQIATVDPPLVTLGGNGFLGATQVTVGSVAVTTGLQVVGDTQLRFTPPVGLPLGFHPVSVTNAAGTGNSSVLWYVGSNPCKVLVPAAVAGGTPFPWRMGGMPNDLGLLGVSFHGTSSPFLGSALLDGFLLLWSGPLDARGMATLTLPVPAGLLEGFTVFSQLLDVVPATNTLRSASATPGTAITW
jgi:hypothetical protein